LYIVYTYISLYRVNKERNILHTISKRKANWIGHTHPAQEPPSKTRY
jgi:hypothetical protein